MFNHKRISEVLRNLSDMIEEINESSEMIAEQLAYDKALSKRAWKEQLESNGRSRILNLENL